jgi:hypothetical protein
VASGFEINREVDMRDAEATDPGSRVLPDAPDPFDTPRLRFYLTHRPDIEAIRTLETEFSGRLKLEVQGTLPSIAEALVEKHGPVGSGLLNWGGGGSKHPMFWDSRWVDAAHEPLAAIGLHMDGFDPSIKCLYAGLFVSNTPAAAPLRAWLKADIPKPPADDWLEGLYPVGYRWLEPRADWWTDLPGWRQSLREGVLEAWDRFAPRVNAAFEAIGTDLPIPAP